MATQQKQSSPSEPAGRGTTSDSAQRIQRVIDDRLFAMHFQPIVDLRSHKVFANEALCRPERDYFSSPVELIKTAVDTEKIGHLGRLQRALAVKNCADSALFVNLEPHEFDEPWLVRPDDPIFAHRHPIYLEITENVPLKYFDQCHSVLAELRKKGNFLAIDDFGAGFSNLKYIAELQPDIVKLDRELVRDCRIGTSDASLLELITDLCHRMNARVVAEGIETPEELEAVLAAGVDFGQGYLLARPAPEPPAIEWPVLPLGAARLAEIQEANEFSPSSKVATGQTDPEAVLKLEKASEREAHLQDEIKKLTDLLVQSEVARLGLVRRLQDTPDGEPADSTTPSKRGAPSDSPRTTAEPSPGASPADADTSREVPVTESAVTESAPTGWLLEQPTLEPGVAFSAGEEKRRIPRSALLIPALALALFLGWFFWPDTGDSLVGQQATLASPAEATVAVAGNSPIRPGNRPAGVGQPATRSIPPDPALEHPEGTGAADEQPVAPGRGETELPAPAGIEEASTREATPLPAEQTSASNAPAIVTSAPEPSPDTTTAISSRIERWVAAWTAQNPTDYLTFYSVSFETPSGESFGDWADGRRQRIAGPDWITVDLSDVEIRLTSSDRALASFAQTYTSPAYRDRVRKTQLWVFEYGNWHIRAESSEPL